MSSLEGLMVLQKLLVESLGGTSLFMWGATWEPDQAIAGENN